MFHSQRFSQARGEWSRAGGRGKGNAARARKLLAPAPGSVADLSGVLFETIRDVRAGVIAPPIAGAIATLARAALSVSEATDFEARLAALEAKAAYSDEEVKR